jgi:hypothetical protein
VRRTSRAYQHIVYRLISVPYQTSNYVVELLHIGLVHGRAWFDLMDYRIPSVDVPIQILTDCRAFGTAPNIADTCQAERFTEESFYIRTL